MSWRIKPPMRPAAEADDRPANGTDDAAAEQTHKKRAFDGEVGELVGRTVKTKDYADQEGGDKKEHEF
jgi:hypothetical protein